MTTRINSRFSREEAEIDYDAEYFRTHGLLSQEHVACHVRFSGSTWFNSSLTGGGDISLRLMGISFGKKVAGVVILYPETAI